MCIALQVLLVEDSVDDAELIVRELRQAGYDPHWQRVETTGDLETALSGHGWDVVLSDYAMPRFSGPEALRQVQRHDGDLPVILVSGEVSQDAAVEAMKAGARDYVMKGDLARLAPVVKRELAEAARRRAARRERAESDKAMRRRLAAEREVASVLIRLAAAPSDGIDACVTGALQSIAAITGADRSYVFLVTDGAQATVSHFWSAADGAAVGTCLTTPAAAPWWWGELQAGRPIVTIGLGGLPAGASAERALLEARGVRTIAAVPLNAGEVLRGFLGFSAADELPLAPADLTGLLHVVGETIIGALDRAHAERALRESEQRYRDLVENLSEVILRGDAEGNITYASPSVEAFSGYRPDELIGRPFTAFAHPDDCPALIASYRRALGEQLKPIEYRVVLKSGAVHWVRTTSRPLVRDGEPIGLQSVLIDVSDRRLGEEQRELVELLAAQAPVGIVSTDAAGQVTAMNPTAVDLLGSPSEEASRQLNVFAVPALRDAGIDALFRAAIDRGQRGSIEARYRSHWGKESFLSLRVAPLFDAPGRVRGTVAVIEDVTARQQAEQALRDREQRLRSLFDGLGPSLLAGLATPDGRLIEASRSALELTGVTIEQVRGMHIADLPPFAHSEELRERLRDSIARALAGMPTQFDVRIRIQPVGERILDFFVQPLRDAQGEVAYIIGSGVDVTERVRAQEDVARLNDELERRVAERTAQLAEANRELEAFTSSVSHDLHAPLRAIQGFSQMLLSDAPDRLAADVRGDIERIRAAAVRLQVLVDALLELARVTHGDLHRAPVDLSRLAREQAAELQRTAPQRQVSFAIADGLVVDADARLLQVVMENLLGNAWKYTAPRPHAHIELAVEDRDGAPVYVVRDDGVGFDPAHAERLFAPFRRLHGAEFEGTGIGLTTVARIIHRHGGRIWADARLDGGATFSFTLGPSLTS